MIVASVAFPVLGQVRASKSTELPKSPPAPTEANPATSTGPQLSGLISQWRGEGDATDSAGRNDGTWKGTAAYGPGVNGQAFVFDGTNFVETGTDGMPTGDGDRTMMLWVRVDAFPGRVSSFAGYGGFGAINHAFELYVDEGGMVSFSQWGDGFTGPQLHPGAWYHVAVSSTGSQLRLYLNGNLVGVRSLPLETSGESRFLVGRTTGETGVFLKGSVDEVSLYGRALSAAEIRSIFQSGFGGNAERVVPTLTVEDRMMLEASQVLNDADEVASQGNYKTAIPMLERAAELFEKSLGPRNHMLRRTLTLLGKALDRMGEYERARPPLERALALSPTRDVTLTLENMLARVSFHLGQYDDAKARLDRVITTYGNHVYSLVNLADIYAVEGNDAKAESLYLQTLTLGDEACHGCWGPGHPAVRYVLNSLALLYCRRGEYDKAEQMALQSLATLEKERIPENPDACGALGPLGTVYKVRGEYEKAAEVYRRGLALLENAYGPEHPDVALFLTYLAEVSWAQGDTRHALPLLARGEEVHERNIALNISIGSAGQKLGYLSQFGHDVDRVVSFNLQASPSDPGAARLALTTILRRKARALDAAADSVATLRRHASPADRTALDELEQARTQLAALVLQGVGSRNQGDYRADVSELARKTEDLESAISAHSAEFRAQSAPVTVEGVQAAIPLDAALVEIVRYLPRDPRTLATWGTPRYAAYVLTREGEPRCVELGDARRIDASANRFRAALGDPRRRDVKGLGRQLDALVMQPVRGLLRGESRLLLSPDGGLNLVPFAALVDEQHRYLVERYAITNVTSGRDLLRLREHVDSFDDPLVVADPDFYANGVDVAPQHGEARGIDIARLRFVRLRGSADEALALGTMLENAVVLTKSRATKAALRQARAPTILHVATHGFFLDDAKASAADTRRMELVRSGAVRSDLFGGGIWIENPLLRSGLALAGANRPDGGVRDGVLTALEASGLDLWGTQLVVLSACNTGVGEVRNGNGVYGLRRALVIAGAETQVVSLWAVADLPTRDLMVAYYRALLAGRGRGDAMREVQLESLASKSKRHPAFWAGFIVSGDWRPLNPKLASK